MTFRINKNDYSPEDELLSLPRNYTLEMAIQNNDIIRYSSTTYNTDRLHEFLSNYSNGIYDKIRIATFGVDGPVSMSIAQYDGNIVKLTIDSTRFNSGQIYNYFGYDIVSQLRHINGITLKDINLITTDNLNINIFTFVYD